MKRTREYPYADVDFVMKKPRAEGKFSINHGDTPIALIQKPNGDDDVVYLDKYGDFPEIQMPERIFPCFHVEQGDAFAIFISGRKKSGKSWLIKEILQEVLSRVNKKVYLISPHTVDPSIDDGFEEGVIIRLEPNEYQMELVKDSIVIFDDVDSLPDEKIIDKVYLFVKKLLQGARKQGTDVIFANHTLRNSGKTKAVIRESDFYFIFPGTGNDAQIESFMKEYVDKDRQTIRDILSVRNSRWVMIHNAAPFFVLTEHDIYMPMNRKF